MSRHYLYFKDLILNSLKNLRQNKRRSLLTALGIIIGVSSVIVIVAIGAGAQNLILSQVESFGSDLIGVLPGKSEDKGPPASVMGINITTLTYEDALALQDPRNVPNIVAVAPFTRSVETASWGGNQYSTNISGTTGGYLTVEGGEVARGRWFSQAEESNIAKVAVLGSALANELFGQTDPLGRHLKIKNQNFEIIGVMAERGLVGFQDYDNQIFLPLVTMQKLVAGVNHLGLLRAKVNGQANVEQVMENVKITLRLRHRINDPTGASDDFTVRSAAQALEMLTTITDALTFFLAAMAALSLVVGGIGIMNIMLVRVTQRTREIGLRKAVGANNGDIRWQFLVEAAVITLSGGLIGIALGETGAGLIAAVVNYLGYDWGWHFSFPAIALAVGISVGIGLIFGLYPAFKAGKLNPIEALRHE